MTKFFLDARSLEHPEPLEKAISILRDLKSDGYLYMLHRKQPLPLIALAKEHSLTHLAFRDERDEWHILITPARNVNLENLLEKDPGA